MEDETFVWGNNSDDVGEPNGDIRAQVAKGIANILESGQGVDIVAIPNSSFVSTAREMDGLSNFGMPVKIGKTNKG